MTASESSSTRPYMIRALHEWCTDNGLTPYLAVRVDHSVQVPQEFVKDGEIVLNTSYDATGGLQLGNDFIAFKARFGGQPRDIMVPVGRVIAIYARETGEGMAFALSPEVSERNAAGDAPAALSPVPSQGEADAPVVQLVPADDGDAAPQPPRTPPSGGARPALKRVK
ncbi:ClpXP protease specificity-enhancing factor [Comamonas endophytica]|uniref:ClpXP protease specificity-enhancing factor n=1 Tax=Comamonas endophytica TaxID=2949090 RepID=A0ABY6GCB1_9BURK|nr:MULTISPECIES: ClpXP protease specificity-enhancing factor [unclassified Acidovorax]MCD2512984.1 ClpXP protease specificity-enhancing factor [Acidovorax sp. D4N7]UYG52674.1 ClpXP protease specificity-enhancing factor [Acidovorax sp. 5MLIR]